MNADDCGVRIIVYNEVDGSLTDLLFDHFPVRIGRNQHNELVLNHQYVSQWHAMVVYEDNVLSMVQVGRSNSVMVNEHRLSPKEMVQLTGNEAIRIVPFQLQVLLVNLQGSAISAPSSSTNSGVLEAENKAGSDQLTMEDITFQSLDRLSNRFLGINLQDPQEVVAFANRLEETLDVFMRFFVALQKGQEQFRQAMDIQVMDASQVERADDSSTLAWLLLSSSNPEAIRELEHAFKNTMIHQVALLNGLMAGVRTLLAKLSPEAVTKEASETRRSPSIKTLWQTYERIHADLAEEDNETFETIFGPQFSKAYSALVGQKATKKKKKKKKKKKT